MKTYVYQAVLTPDEDGGYDVEFPSLPGCFTCGDTIAEAAEQSVDAASHLRGRAREGRSCRA